MIHNAVGKPVEGSDFYDRQEEQTQLWMRLETDDILLLAPRRVGKTSLMYRLRDTAGEHGFKAMYVSVADAESEAAFVRRLLTEIQKHSEKKAIARKLEKSAVAGLFRRVKKVSMLSAFEVELGDRAEAQWAAAGEAIVTALHALGGKWLLLVDEVPIFILSLLRADGSGARARTFLNWFRGVRQDAAASRSVRWFLAGSIGLDTVTRRLNFGDTINDLYLFNEFGAFSRETAERFLHDLAASHSVELKAAVIQAICDRAGWLIPFHLQLMFAELRGRCLQRAPEAADLDAVYEHLLTKKTYFDYWEQRLHEELGKPDDARAIALLNAVAADSHGVTEQTLSLVLKKHVSEVTARTAALKYLLDVLQSDGYVIQEEGRYRFRSSLLREYWRRHVA